MLKFDEYKSIIYPEIRYLRSVHTIFWILGFSVRYLIACAGALALWFAINLGGCHMDALRDKGEGGFVQGEGDE